MEVIITKASGPKFWYANRIGESFHVLTSVNGKHRIDTRHYPDKKFLHGYFIDAEDCLPKKEEVHSNSPVKEEDVYRYSCVNCDWVFKYAANQELKCPYCKEHIITNPFNETDGVYDLGGTSIII